MGLDGRVAGGAVRVSTMGGLRGDALGKRRPRTGDAVRARLVTASRAGGWRAAVRGSAVR